MAEHADATGAEHLMRVEKLLGLLGSGAMSQVISVAAELDIPNRLARGPKMVDELASATACHAPSLHRLMRALATIEFCTELHDGSFALTATGSLLQSKTRSATFVPTQFGGEGIAGPPGGTCSTA